MTVTPFSLRDAPALIERLLPVQKLSSESFKEQSAVQGKTLTALGSYWKGRKPLVLNKACILGALLPATANPQMDLEVFELLMAMDDESIGRRADRIDADDVLRKLPLRNPLDHFVFEPLSALPEDLSRPFDVDDYGVAVRWRRDVEPSAKLAIVTDYLKRLPYRERVSVVQRAESVDPAMLYGPSWDTVNRHLGTEAHSFPELMEQLGIMRYGHRPKVADTFTGSGQIPFEAARLGCDAYASDINPVGCMLSWGTFNVVGASVEDRQALEAEQVGLFRRIKDEIDALGVETDGAGWRGKIYLYCIEVTCPSTGWLVPLLPTCVVSKGGRVIARLVPVPAEKRYDIEIVTGASDAELAAAESGTYEDESVCHTVDDVDYRTKLSTIRGDHTSPEGKRKNRLRPWTVSDIDFRPDDLYHERLYAIQWIEDLEDEARAKTQFRSVSPADVAREHRVKHFVQEHLADWQARGWVPDMRIEPGDKTDEPIRTRGWTHWHHLFNPRQLLLASLIKRHARATGTFAMTQVLNLSCRLSRFAEGGRPNTKGAFDNQALNTLLTYGCRGLIGFEAILETKFRHYPLTASQTTVRNHPAAELREPADIFVTDPPYGDAVKYEEILEFFIAWMRKNPPEEFSQWVWDSRRALAIKGEDDEFRANMVAAYKRMAECMPDNGLQIIMFTHQSSEIWADLANIVWASGLRVTAAWYVVTETDSALREGSYVKGTVLLVLRKRTEARETFRDDLAYEIEDAVKEQVELLSGLNQTAKAIYRDENLFEDADLQMAGYAAALKVLTQYATIDGLSMPEEALRPRERGRKAMVDALIEFAVHKAQEFLVPRKLTQDLWRSLAGPERFYLKMADLESQAKPKLDDYQNYAKAFRLQQYRPLMGSMSANHARLKTAVELGRSEMIDTDEFGGTPTRGLLYGIYSLLKDDDAPLALHQLRTNVAEYHNIRERLSLLADYLAAVFTENRPAEAQKARVLRDLIRNDGF